MQTQCGYFRKKKKRKSIFVSGKGKCMLCAAVVVAFNIIKSVRRIRKKDLPKFRIRALTSSFLANLLFDPLSPSSPPVQPPISPLQLPLLKSSDSPPDPSP